MVAGRRGGCFGAAQAQAQVERRPASVGIGRMIARPLQTTVDVLEGLARALILASFAQSIAALERQP